MKRSLKIEKKSRKSGKSMNYCAKTQKLKFDYDGGNADAPRPEELRQTATTTECSETIYTSPTWKGNTRSVK